jgi:hypothetical protein
MSFSPHTQLKSWHSKLRMVSQKFQDFITIYFIPGNMASERGAAKKEETTTGCFSFHYRISTVLSHSLEVSLSAAMRIFLLWTGMIPF